MISRQKSRYKESSDVDKPPGLFDGLTIKL